MDSHVRADHPDNYYTSARCPICMKQVNGFTINFRKHQICKFLELGSAVF